MKRYLWNQCDHSLMYNPLNFKLCAWLLHLAGDDYWFTSLDYTDLSR